MKLSRKIKIRECSECGWMTILASPKTCPKCGGEMKPMKSAKGNKFKARPETIDGLRFASGKEAMRYRILKAMAQADEIESLVCHPVFRIVINGIDCGKYTADFDYLKDGKRIIEDCKGGDATKTEAYRLRKKIVEALHGITIQEV